MAVVNVRCVFCDEPLAVQVKITNVRVDGKLLSTWTPSMPAHHCSDGMTHREPEPPHWSKSLGDILTWDEHAGNYYGHITERRYETLPEDHDALMLPWVHDALSAYTQRVNPFKAAWRAFKAARWANLGA